MYGIDRNQIDILKNLFDVELWGVYYNFYINIRRDERMKIIIFGAGFYGKKCFQFLTSIGVKVDYFCQTRIENENSLYEIPILDITKLSKIKSNKIIFLAIKDCEISVEIRERIQREINSVVNIYNFCDLNSGYDLLYDGLEFEVRIMQNYWNRYFTDSDYLKTKRDALCYGLLKEDEKKVNKTIERMKQFVVEKSFSFDIFTIEEKKEIKYMERDLDQNISFDSKDGISFYIYKKYKLYENYFEPNLFYYRMGIDQIQNIEKVKGKDIIDAGAYIGDSAIILSDYTDKKVYAFEAFYDNYKKIIKTAELNNKTNIVPVNKALGEDCSVRKFYVRSDSDTGHGMLERDNLSYEKEININQITLDEYVEENRIRVGLIKVDIEGAERKFLCGAKKTIREQKPVLLLSIYHTANDFFELKLMVEELKAGYSFKIFQPLTRSSFLLETALICEVL